MRRGMYTSTRTAMHVDQGTTFTLHLLVLAALRVEHPHVYGPVLGSDRGVLDIGAFAFRFFREFVPPQDLSMVRRSSVYSSTPPRCSTVVGPEDRSCFTEAARTVRSPA